MKVDQLTMHIGLSNHQARTLRPCPQGCKVATFLRRSTRNPMRSTHRISPDYTVCMHYTYQGTL